MKQTRDVPVPGRRGSLRARLYVPRGAPEVSPGLLYLHGGGFVIGSPETHDRLTRELAERIGARVLSLDYALAPEHPYPAGLEDCVDAARWLAAHAAELGMDPRRLLIGGDSAGANLSAATLLKLRDGGAPSLFTAALLLYGRFLDEDTDSLRAWGERELILSRKVMKWFGEAYGKTVRGDPYVAPAKADLRGFPPAILIAGTLDPLLSDSQLFAAALRQAGVEAELHVVEDGLHAFAQLSVLDMCAAAVDTLAEFARRHLQPPMG